MMINLIDYIFYRTYIAYQRKGHSARFSASAYLSAIFLFLLSPIYSLLRYLLDEYDKWQSFAFYFYMFSVIAYFFFRFYRNGKVKRILKDYGSIKYNDRISSVWFFLILPFSMLIGIAMGLYMSLLLDRY